MIDEVIEDDPIDHSAYRPDPRVYPKHDSGRTYCPGCLRIARWGTTGPALIPTFWRHFLDPQAPKGERDRCINSRQPIAEAWFVRASDHRVVPRHVWEATR
jgi:hypothetical protein